MGFLLIVFGAMAVSTEGQANLGSAGLAGIYMAYLGVTIPLLRQRLQGWPRNLPTVSNGLFTLGGLGVITNVNAVGYGASMVINLAWPRDYFYGTEWYQQCGPMILAPLAVIVGLILYFGYQQHRTEILPEHRAEAAVAPETP